MTKPIVREELLAELRQERVWDLAVIGGGATGLGLALDAAARGLTVVLLEADDFAKGTSSRATKLVHGGVRYLAQGNIGLVREALHERATLLHNAPHLVQPLPFVVPSYHWWETPYYAAGLLAYDALAGRRGLGATQILGKERTLALLPGARSEGLRGGVKYWDGQFDDARLAVLLARSARARGALVVNHCGVDGLLREQGKVKGVRARDAESGEVFKVRARCVVNATGVWVDELRALDRDDGDPAVEPMVAPSQGVHLVVDRDFMPGTHGLMVPKTADGRVLFAVPWMGKIVLGTTDTPATRIEREPRPFAEEVDFILTEAGRYLARAPQRADVRSVWVGLRPLVKPPASQTGHTKSISREHTVVVDASGMVTVTGGKWTTYRAMAEDVLAQAMDAGLLPRRPAGVTNDLPLLGAPATAPTQGLAAPPGAHLYGSESAVLMALPGADRWLWRDGEGGLSEAMVRFAARFEMARSVEDVLARRSRLLFLDAAQAHALAAPVAALLQDELGPAFDAAASVAAFETLAKQYASLP